ncbi:MAG: cysteine desulfurase [Spirochaetes bacterium]|nr:cysteine desulfurase [Spirochaetota bacterium]
MIYLDNNATTPLHPEVKKKIIETLDYYGNPSSAHQLGRETRNLLETSRAEIASFLNCDPEEIIFTAGGSEANNTILKSVATCCHVSSHRNHVITTNIEHPSVLNTMKCLEDQNVEVTYLDIDQYGIVNPEELRKAIKPETSLISIMYANNEIGTIQPIEELVAIAKEKNIPFHTDAVQAIGKIPIDLAKLPVDYLSLSGHKIYAPKGIGVLFKRRGTKKICPLISGGHQENSMRAGTENIIGIIGLGEAFRQLRMEMQDEVNRMEYLRNKLEKGIIENIPNVRINGHPDKRLPSTLNVSFNNIEGESILLRLDLYGITVSTGSACSTGSLEPSHVIMALKVDPEVAHSSVRFSLGRENTEADIDKTLESLNEVVSFLRKLSPVF